MVNYNGDLLPAPSHFLNHTNRGLRFGDALCETVKFSGRGLLFWEDHYFRLMASMRQLRMEIPMTFSMEFLEAEIRKTLEAAGAGARPAAVRITIFRKEGTSLAPDSLEIAYVLEASPLDTPEYPMPAGALRADIYKDHTLMADDLSALPQANALIRVLGSIYARENELQTCILLNHRKEVCDALEGNLFVRFGPHIVTPPADSGCRNDVFRSRILAMARTDTTYTWEERAVSPFELQQADEIFIGGVAFGIRSITEYRKARFGSEAAAYLTERINKMVQEEGL